MAIATGALLGIDKDIYISLLNSLLLLLIYIYLRKNRTDILLILLFMTQFYVVVLMTGAERLKIAYIFLMLAAVNDGGGKRILYIAGALLSHFQIALLLTSFFSASAINIKHGLKSGYSFKLICRGLIFLIFIVILLSIFGEAIVDKLRFYTDRSFSFIDLFQVLGLTVYLTFVVKYKLRILLAMLPFCPIILFLGGDRVNMIAFTVGMYFVILEGRQNSISIYILMIYMFVKAVDFVSSIYLYGNGFA